MNFNRLNINLDITKVLYRGLGLWLRSCFHPRPLASQITSEVHSLFFPNAKKPFQSFCWPLTHYQWGNLSVTIKIGYRSQKKKVQCSVSIGFLSLKKTYIFKCSLHISIKKKKENYRSIYCYRNLLEDCVAYTHTGKTGKSRIPFLRKIIKLNESWNYEYLVRPSHEKEIDCTVQTAELWFVFSELIELSSDLCNSMEGQLLTHSSCIFVQIINASHLINKI